MAIYIKIGWEEPNIDFPTEYFGPYANENSAARALRRRYWHRERGDDYWYPFAPPTGDRSYARIVKRHKRKVDNKRDLWGY